MSKIERVPGRNRRPLFRIVAAGAAALFLVSAAYQSANAGAISDYIPLGTEDDDDGLSGGEIAGIAIAGLLVGGAVAYSLGWFGLGGRRRSDEPAKSSQVLPLPDDAKDLSGIRLTPATTKIEAGGQQVMDLQVRRKSDGQWYTVSARPEALLSVRTGDGTVVLQEGTKNVVCVPLTASRASNGKMVVVTGRFAPEGLTPLSTEARIQVQVETSTLSLAR